jgi:hypothetical protein
MDPWQNSRRPKDNITPYMLAEVLCDGLVIVGDAHFRGPKKVNLSTYPIGDRSKIKLWQCSVETCPRLASEIYGSLGCGGVGMARELP